MNLAIAADSNRSPLPSTKGEAIRDNNDVKEASILR